MAMRSRRSTRTKSPIDQTPLMRARRFGGRGLQQRAIATEGHEIAEQRRCSGNGHNHPDRPAQLLRVTQRSEEHTSELQSLMRISYAVFCLKKKTKQQKKYN